MRDKLIPLVTMLVAGAATSLVCIIYKYDTLYSLKLLLGVLLCFYLIGLIAKKLLMKVIREDEEEEQEDGQEGEEGQEDGGEGIEEK